MTDLRTCYSLDMPFEKGHPLYPTKNGLAPGRDSIAVRRHRSLAAYMTDAISEREIFRWLRAVAAGKDPDAKPNEVYVPPDWSTRKAAMSMILDRRLGKPTDHVVIQQEIRASIGVASVSASPESIAAMSPEDKVTLRNLLRKVAQPVSGAGDAAVRAVVERARAEEDDGE